MGFERTRDVRRVTPKRSVKHSFRKDRLYIVTRKLTGKLCVQYKMMRNTVPEKLSS
jgi:hypothetical protein